MWYNICTMSRLSIPQYVMALAHVAALRSEDPYRRVGAAALDKDNRVIGTAYNGLFPGFTAPEGFWASRDERQKYMLHAEINLCSLFKRGEAKVVACTTMPCTSCMQALCAHGVKTIYYGEAYPDSQAPAIAAMYGVELIHVPEYPLSRSFPLVTRRTTPDPVKEALKDRARGCMMGLMCGDALGAPLEFHDDDEVAAMYPNGIPGMVDGWDVTRGRYAGMITDDSEMAIALMHSLAENGGYDETDTLLRYQEWAKSGCDDIGGATMQALVQCVPSRTTQANGALMRVAPLGIFAALHPEFDWLSAAVQDAQLTHPHSKCIAADIIYVESIMLAVQGKSPAEIYAAACTRAAAIGEPALVYRLEAAATKEPDYWDHEGWVEIAFHATYYYLLHSERFADAACTLVMRLGDPDTNGAIACALLGAVYGYKSIPQEWREAVMNVKTDRPSEYTAPEGMRALEVILP